MIDKDAFNWLNKNQLSYDIWNNKYKNENENFNDWLERVSKGNNNIKQLILEKKFLFGGRILANRGLGQGTTLSNCYVEGYVPDSIEGILDTCKNIALTYSRGGGQGINISKLRPKGAKVNNSAKTSTGAVSFMELFSQVTATISQGSRKGALMLCMDVYHPDILDFINIKTNINSVTKANISVLVDDAFMNGVRENKIEDREWIVDSGEVMKYVVNYKEIYTRMMEVNRDFAEPGILFWDKVVNYNLMQNFENFVIEGTNPCGELPLQKGGACLLGSMVLPNYVKNNEFDWYNFKKDIDVAVRDMDICVDENLGRHALDSQNTTAKNFRAIGLGFLGLGDVFIKLKMTYGENDSVDLANKISYELLRQSVKTSILLAEEKGCFPAYNDVLNPYEKYISSDLFKKLNIDEEYLKKLKLYGIRNCQLTTVAPTGSLGTMLGYSTGIEPHYMISYKRTTQSLHESGEVTYDVFVESAKDYLLKNNLSLKVENLPKYFIASNTLNWEKRLKVQSAIQEFIDNSISSTVNLPSNTTTESIMELYLRAYELNLKGVTIFVDNCKRSQILFSDDEEELSIKNELPRGFIEDVNDDLIGRKRKLISGCGSLHCSLFFDCITGEPKEIYLSKGSSGGCVSNLTALSRMMSLAFRGGLSIESIVDQLNSSLVCPSYTARRVTKKDTSKGSSCGTAIAYAMMDMYNEIKNDLGISDVYEFEEIDEIMNYKDEETSILVHENKYKCPECGEPLVSQGGCVICLTGCGYTKCD